MARGIDERRSIVRSGESRLVRALATRPTERCGVSVLAVVAALTAGGCALGGSTREPARSSSCASAVQWNGNTYFGNSLAMPHGRRVGTGTIPPCENGGTARRVSLNRLRGVNPTVALAVAGDHDTVFLAEGFFPQLASHPVHEAIQRRSGPLPRPRHCRNQFERTGTVTAVQPLLLRSGRDDVAIELYADTRITGFLRAGEPYLQVGDRIIVRGRVCAGRTLFGDRIRPAR
jgi:hypothetical protein